MMDIVQLQGIAIEMGEAAARACEQRDALNEIAQTWAALAAEHADELERKNRQIEKLVDALRVVLMDHYDGGLPSEIYDRLLSLISTGGA